MLNRRNYQSGRDWQLQIFWSKAGMPGNSRQHSRTDLLAIMESEDVIGPICALKDSMRTAAVSFDRPTDSA
jgi:hypothetical protein